MGREQVGNNQIILQLLWHKIPIAPQSSTLQNKLEYVSTKRGQFEYHPVIISTPARKVGHTITVVLFS